MFFSFSQFKRNLGFASFLLLGSLAYSHHAVAMEYTDDEINNFANLRQEKISNLKTHLRIATDAVDDYNINKSPENYVQAIKSIWAYEKQMSDYGLTGLEQKHHKKHLILANFLEKATYEEGIIQAPFKDKNRDYAAAMYGDLMNVDRNIGENAAVRNNMMQNYHNFVNNQNFPTGTSTIQFLWRDADQGFLPAIYTLGKYYFYKTPETNEGEFLLRKAALRGFMNAQNALGEIYMQRKNRALAATYYEAAAEQGHQIACSRMISLAFNKEANTLDPEMHDKWAAVSAHLQGLANSLR